MAPMSVHKGIRSTPAGTEFNILNMLTSDAIAIDHEYARKAYGICVHHHFTGQPGCLGELRELFAKHRAELSPSKQADLSLTDIKTDSLRQTYGI